MRRLILLTLLFSFICICADAQVKRKSKRPKFVRKKPAYRYEMVGSLGVGNFLGELGGADQIGTNGIKDLEYVLTSPAIGVGLRYKFERYVSTKANLNFGIVRGDDKLTQEYFRNRRNINFKSPLIELTVQAEFNFLREQKGHIYKIRGVRGLKHKEKQLYCFGGGGAVYFNPRGKYTDGSWHNLHQYQTEGVNYSRITGVLLVGGGFKYAVNRYWGLGFEMGMRKTFTDYIDDVSKGYADPTLFTSNPKAAYFANPGKDYFPIVGEQRGDPTDKDAYMFATFTVNYKIMYRKRSRSKF